MIRIKSPAGIIVLVTIVVIGSSLAGLLGSMAYIAYQGRHLRTRLLCKTDHQALLEACQQLSEWVKTGKLEPGAYRVRGRPDRETAKLPEAIRTLQPALVAIDRIDRHVKIEMFGGWDNFGVYAYPKDFEKRFPFEYHDRKLLEGLWYYDDLYGHGRKDEYDKKVDALLAKCGKLKEQTDRGALQGQP